MRDRLPAAMLRAFPLAAGAALLGALLLALFAPRVLLAQRAGRVPPGHLPPPGLCRVWYDRVPPGRQPAATDCATARAEAWRTGGRVIVGGRDDVRRDRDRRDGGGWWGIGSARRDPWWDNARRDRDDDWRDRRSRRDDDDDDDDDRRRRRDGGWWDGRRTDGDEWKRRRDDAGTWEQRREEARRRKEGVLRGEAPGPWKRDRTGTVPPWY